MASFSYVGKSAQNHSMKSSVNLFHAKWWSSQCKQREPENENPNRNASKQQM